MGLASRFSMLDSVFDADWYSLARSGNVATSLGSLAAADGRDSFGLFGPISPSAIISRVRVGPFLWRSKGDIISLAVSSGPLCCRERMNACRMSLSGVPARRAGGGGVRRRRRHLPLYRVLLARRSSASSRVHARLLEVAGKCRAVPARIVFNARLPRAWSTSEPSPWSSE